ncbi:MAG: methyltransferase domain-containing protein [Deltaproteobacteria bacterium]|nr:methyltransferase domain-containing protein [Deltaproteobacteria bacterium]
MLLPNTLGSTKRRDKFREFVNFANTFARYPRRVGALAPSSKVLAKAMISGLEWSKYKAVLEYGSGTGAITAAILAKLSPKATFVAIEASKSFEKHFQSKFPSVKLHIDSVANVETICRQENIGKADCIISSLPWAIFSKEEQTQFLQATANVMAKDGVFTTFAYLQSLATPGERRFLSILKDTFQEVELMELVWRNIPPAVVIRATKLR